MPDDSPNAMPDPTPDPSPCPTCGDPLPADAAGGACPRCLLVAGFETGGGGADAAGPDDAPAPEALAPKFPGLEIQAVLGRGGMGVVYRARHRELDRVVALKVLPARLAADPAFADRFRREARALARLQHPGIVAVHDFGETDGLCWLVMEHVEGVNLRQAMRAGRIGPREALAIVPQICDALQYAHEHGVVHRDVKPENVLLDAAGRVKVADFGLAKLAGGPGGGGAADAGAALTGVGQVIGTPQYMAPEQWEHPATVDHRADIYALGVVFYEMLTGELPLGRFAAPSVKAEIDARIDEIVLRTLEKEREARYQHAADVKTDVGRVTSGGGAAGARTVRVVREFSFTAHPPTPRREMLFGAGLALIGTGLWLAWDRNVGFALLPLTGVALMVLAGWHQRGREDANVVQRRLDWVLGVGLLAAGFVITRTLPAAEAGAAVGVTVSAVAALVLMFRAGGLLERVRPPALRWTLVALRALVEVLLIAGVTMALLGRFSWFDPLPAPAAIPPLRVPATAPPAPSARDFDAVDEFGGPIEIRSGGDITSDDIERIAFLWKRAKAIVPDASVEAAADLYALPDRTFDAARLARARKGELGLPLVGSARLPGGLAGFRLVRVELGMRGPASVPTSGVAVATDGRRMLRFGLSRWFVRGPTDPSLAPWEFAATRVEVLDAANVPPGPDADAILRLVDLYRTIGPQPDLTFAGSLYTKEARDRIAAIPHDALAARGAKGGMGLPLAWQAFAGPDWRDLVVEAIGLAPDGGRATVTLRDCTENRPGATLIDVRVARDADGSWRFTDDPLVIR